MSSQASSSVTRGSKTAKAQASKVKASSGARASETGARSGKKLSAVGREPAGRSAVVTRTTRKRGASDPNVRSRFAHGISGRPELDGLVAGVLEHGGVCIVAPDGMGKTCELQSQIVAYKRRGWDVAYVDCGKADTDWILSRLEEVRERTEHVLVCVDDVPAFEEDEWDRVAQELVALAISGSRIAVALRPELGFLADALPFEVVGSTRMRVLPDEVAGWEGVLPSASPTRVLELSQGIASLVAPASTLLGAGPRTEFDEAVERLVRASLKGPLMDDERELRLAMLLLGSGTVSQLESAIGGVDLEILLEMEREEPLFGIDLSTMSFCCAGTSDDDCLDACIGVLAEQAGDWQPLVRGVCDELVRTGRPFRAGLVARSCLSAVGCASFVRAWPIELINSGNLQLVDEFTGEGFGPKGSFGACVGRMAVACANGDEGAYAKLSETCPESATTRERAMAEQLAALHAARMTHRSLDVQAEVPAEPECQDELASALWCHVRVRRMLLEGRAHEAFRTLLVCGHARSGETLASALLCEDFDIARTLVGDLPNRHDDAGSRAAATFLISSGMRDLMAYGGCVSQMAAALAGRRPVTDEAERCLGRASRRGDGVVQAYLMLAHAATDLRERSFARAAIRARRACEHAEASGCVRAALLAGLVDAVAECATGSVDPMRTFAAGCPDASLACLALLIAAQTDGDQRGAEEARRQLEGLDCPHDLLPGLGAIAHALDARGEELLQALPASWGHALEAYEHALSIRFPEEDDAGDPESEDGDGILRVRMLGELAVSVGGVRVSESSWKRSAARKLLMLLAATEGHVIARGRALEAIWPEADFIRGRGNLYTASSALRATLAGAGGCHPYVGGPEGYVSLNPEFARCDVDEFTRSIRELTSGEHPDAWIVAQCRRIRATYVGDLVVPTPDHSGLFVRRRDELRRNYVDAMVLGSEAALRVGAAQEAVWLAESAYHADDMREDAISDLLMALIATGRAIEARETYERYAARTVEQTGMPPALRVRRVMGELAEGSGRRPGAPGGRLESDGMVVVR